jgi:hypothetical protein
MKIHIVPKYENTYELAGLVHEMGIPDPKAVMMSNFSLISGDVRRVDESAFEEFKYNLRQKDKRRAYAMTITAPKRN